jgi:predicted Rossmann fold flavoprotein
MPSLKQRYDLIVIGGGAAGFFGAINAAEMSPGLRVLILEKSTKLLSKVKVSGGGRCNVTHHCFSPAPLSQHYPRGQRPLKNLFHHFQATETVAWFESRGVKLKAEEDGRMFPITDDSQTIIDLFLRETEKFKIEIKLSQEVLRIERKEDQFSIYTSNDQFLSKQVLVAMGGHNKEENYQWLKESGHEIVRPIPSLFTFNDSEKDFVPLMGVAVPNGEVKIASSKLSQKGAILITHWGLSGPAVIKLSAWAAEDLFKQNYTFTALINWTGISETEVREVLMKLKETNSKKQIVSSPLFNVPKRLWEHLCIKAEIEDKKIWADLPNKSINRLIELLYCCPFKIRGKTTFKEEFVTCGGIALTDIDITTMQSKKLPGLYFAGEVLNLDGETGGFNFQAAWTTSYIAAKAIAIRK